MDATRDYHTKWSQKEKDKYHMISLKYRIWHMAQMNLSIKDKTHREQTWGCQGGRGEEEEQLGVWGW